MSYFFAKTIANSLFIRDYEGDKRITSFPELSFFFESSGKSEKSGYKTLQGKDTSRFFCRNIKEFKEKKEEITTDNMILYGQNLVEYQYINSYFPNAGITNVVSPRTLFLDIETLKDQNFGYSRPQEAKNIISAISMFDVQTETIYVFALGKKFNVTGFPYRVIFYDFDSEDQLLLKFLDVFESINPHVISGWNSYRFDIPYIINRSILFFKKEFVENKLSPFNRIFETKTQEFGKDVEVWDIVGINHLDYMELYKKFSYGDNESLSLNFIAHKELGEKKLDYSEYSDLQELQEKNFQKFIEYNIKDVLLVSRLDEKLKYIELIHSIAWKAKCNVSDVFSPVKTWEILIYNYLFDKNVVIPIKKHTNEKKIGEKSIVGGYVKNIEGGLRNWVITFDAASLYPSIIRQYNIGAETLLKRCVSEEATTAETISHFLKEALPDLEKLKELNVTVTGNGYLYKKDEKSFFAAIMEELYNERKKTKNEMMVLKEKVEHIEKGDAKEIKKQISSLNARQNSLKTLLNAGFGSMAQPYFQWYDPRLAESITATGQIAIQYGAKRIDEFLNKLLNTKDVEYAYYIDTDSIFITLEEVVNRFMPNRSKKATIEFLDRFSKTQLEPFFDQTYKEFFEQTNARDMILFFKREVIADKSIHLSKKKYCMNVHNSEGISYTEPKLKIMGVEAVRSSTPEICRKAIKETIRLILQSTENEMQNYIKTFRETFFSASVDEISFPRGITEIEKWEIRGKNGFVLKKGTPIHVRGAIIHNKLIILLSLEKKYDKVKNSDKIKYCYLSMPNWTNNNVIAFKEFLPPEFELEGFVDFKTQWSKSFVSPIEELVSLRGWTIENTANGISKFFS